MATGIISVGTHLTGYETVSQLLLALAGIVWLVLAADFVSRRLWNHQRWQSEANTPGALTAVAATTVLGTRLSLLGWHVAATTLLAVAAVVWPVLLVMVMRHWNRRMPGAVFLVCVSTEGLAVLAATLAHAGVGDWPAVAALVCFFLGLLLYPVAFAHFDRAEIWRGSGDQWVMTGALAISTLAGSKLAAWPHWTGIPHTVLRAATVVLLAMNLLSYVILVVAELIRIRPGYSVRRWATVFPLGMTAVAALSTGTTLHVAWLGTLGRALLFVAGAVWVLVVAELVATRRPARPESSPA
ncbi:hypothetical protein GLP40_23835 [Nocardia sp. CT2-14]|uniref:Uncharacterized protein n=2 Tax=Nocardia aurantiaca TaxID=2675850 RepID=A0A6I3L4C2_9NOCA|nr:hypothetical protein [Nocardia aurantiaca]